MVICCLNFYVCFKFFSDRVNHKPIFEKPLKNVTIKLGGSTEFEAKILTESLSSTITWYRQDCLDENCKLTNYFEVKEISSTYSYIFYSFA